MSEDDIYLPSNAICSNSGIVVYGIIFKRPVDPSDPYSVECIEHEKEIYRRLQHCEGVIPYLDLSGLVIQLPFMNDGTLSRYLQSNSPPMRAQQLAWVKQMVHTLCRIHDRRVLVIDLASRNMLIHPNGSILFCDFGTSILLPIETDIWAAESHESSFETDICQLGAIIYEVVTGRDIADYDQITEDAGGWPPRDKLPSTRGIWLGSIIEACWTKGRFRTTYELAQMLEEEHTLNSDDIDQTRLVWNLHPAISSFVY